MGLGTVSSRDPENRVARVDVIRPQATFELLVMEAPRARDDRADRGERRISSDRDQCVARLFDEHYRGLCRLAGLLLGDSAAAEEVVQEAFLRTFSSWWRVRHPERAQWYLRTSVVNLCRSKLRRRSTEERGNRISWVAEDDQSGPDATDLSDDSAMLVKLVRQLPPRQRDAVVLRYYEDLPEAEIARVLGCAVGTVKSQLSKARATLAAAMEQIEEPPETEANSPTSGDELRTPPQQGGSGA